MVFKRRKILLITVLALATLALAACGGGGGNGDTGDSGNGGTTSEVVMGDFYFEPGTENPIVVEQGEVTLTLVNEGTQGHDLAIEAFDFQSDVVNAGESLDVTFTADQTGSFEIVCTQPGHEDSGMVGTIEVQ